MSDIIQVTYLHAWRFPDEDTWRAALFPTPSGETRSVLEEDGKLIAEMATVGLWGSVKGTLGAEIPADIHEYMTSVGWLFDDENGGWRKGSWRRLGVPDGISADDFPVVWMNKGDATADGDIAVAGYYVEYPCDVMCCAPDGPFETKAGALAFRADRDRNSEVWIQFGYPVREP